MSERRKTVRGLLWEWIDELADPDPEQRAWKVPYFDGMLMAAAATGLLDEDELAAFRRLSRSGSVPPASGDRAAAEAHLRSLEAQLRPMRRDPDPEGLEASQRFHGALEALLAAGLLPDDAGEAWRGEALAAQPSRFDDPHERMARRGDLREVIVCERPDRHEGLALTALVTRTESVELHFHHVGPPQGELGSDLAHHEAFRALVEGLSAPELTDDVGTVYRPALSRPVSSTGTGGIPAPERRQVIRGRWRFFPAPPAEATAFVARRGEARWALRRPRAG